MTKNFFYFIIIFFFSHTNIVYSEIVNKITIEGNNRISSETNNIFSKVSVNDDLDISNLDLILKNIYSTGFFEDVTLNFENNILSIRVIENPIIQNINYEGIKAEKIKEQILKNVKLRPRSSFNEFSLESDKKEIIKSLREIGYFFSEVEVFKKELEDSKVDINYQIKLGKKAKIKKISFLGNKVFKDNKLKSIILTEEYKFWKFLSARKYLNENLTNIDLRLLTNFYKNKGFYNVNINKTFAKLIDEESFELIYNINSGDKIFFNDLMLELPNDFDKSSFTNLVDLFNEIKGKPYSLFLIEKILNQINQITLDEEFRSINALINEEIFDNKINIKFKVVKNEDFYVEKINIYGNSITKENVIRNQFFIDEGDPYNEILKNKTINEIKNLNFFKQVTADVVNGTNEKFKIININVEEKATGEISAAAGVGTNGNSVGFAVKENNFLGNGIGLNSSITLATDSITGIFSVTNPNFLNSDKSINTTIEATEIDKFSEYGYKTSRTGFSFGTNFEFYDDLWLGLGNSNYYQNIETDSTASASQQKQKGDYWDSYLKLDFDFDKRNQKFQTTSGYRSFFSTDIPVVSDTYSLINTYNYQFYTELYEENITTLGFYLNTVNSLSNENVKLSERIFLPSSKLRGFVVGGVGPKDGADFVGGNYASSINLISTLPKLLPNLQNTDLSVFVDAANIWGVDYDSSLNDSNKIRSSFGIALDWLTPIGPLNFSLSQPITKALTDQTESFRFNLGTTF